MEIAKFPPAEAQAALFRSVAEPGPRPDFASRQKVSQRKGHFLPLTRSTKKPFFRPVPKK